MYPSLISNVNITLHGNPAVACAPNLFALSQPFPLKGNDVSSMNFLGVVYLLLEKLKSQYEVFSWSLARFSKNSSRFPDLSMISLIFLVIFT